MVWPLLQRMSQLMAQRGRFRDYSGRPNNGRFLGVPPLDFLDMSAKAKFDSLQ